MNPALPEAYVRGLVSIVIPTYNGARFIRDSINSSLAQDYSSFEVIVVDDGSTDDTPRICSEYGNKIRYFSKPNGGTASALNLGIKRMRGEWFKALGSDDILETNALSAFLEYAAKQSSKLLYCDAVSIDEAGHLLWADRLTENLRGDEFLRALWSGRDARRGFPFGGPASGFGMIHRSVFAQVGLLNDALLLREDWEWHLRSNLVHGLHDTHVPKPLFRVRHHQGQITRSERQRPLEEMTVHTILKDQITRLGETPQPLMEHYRRETRRLQRTYLPVVLLAKLLGKAPGYRTFLPTVWMVAPGLLDCVYWAANPPV